MNQAVKEKIPGSGMRRFDMIIMVLLTLAGNIGCDGSGTGNDFIIEDVAGYECVPCMVIRYMMNFAD